MLNFFRRIRQQLLTSGQMKKPASPFGRYILYGIGEIVLVVFGILIALQVNNWNEARKQKGVEIKLLKEIQSDLEDTLSEINGDYESHLRSQNSGNTFQKYLLENEMFNDTILKHYDRIFRDRQVYPKTSGYDLLQSKGVGIISNDSLRKKITDLYQLTFSRLVEYGASNERYSISNRIQPFDYKYFELSNIPERKHKIEGLTDSLTFYKKVLVNYDNLRNDKDFLRTLQGTFGLRRRKISLHEWAIADSKTVISLIKMELENLD